MAWRRTWIPAALCAALLSGAGARAEDDAGANPEPLQIRDFSYDVDRGLKAGPLAFHAYLAESIAFNDNLMLSQSGKQWDVLSETLAGGRMDIRYGRHKAYLQADATAVKGFQTSVYDHVNASVTLRGLLGGQWFYGEAREQFRYMMRGENLYDTPLGSWVSYVTNEAVLQAGVRLSKLGFELEGGLNHWWFLTSRLQYIDHMEVPLSARVSYNFQKARLFVSGDFGIVDFYKEYRDGSGAVFRLNDYTYYGGTIGGSLAVSGKLDAYLSVGIRIQDVGTGGTVNDTSSYAGFIATLTLSYRFSAKVSTGCVYYRALQFSGTSNYQTTDFFHVYYQHELLPKLTGKLGPRVVYVDPSAHKSFLFVGAYALLDYRLLEWLSAGLRYDLKLRSTDVSGGDYLNNSVSLSVTGYF
jgi:hypothetical protein